MTMNASCHCGSVSVEIAQTPDFINFCDCSLCRKSGGAWGYFTSSQVAVEGPTASYRRADYAEPAVEIHRCVNCGSTTHWILTEHFPGDRVGVNMRLFSPPQLDGIEGRSIDGHNWTGEAEQELRRPHGIIGRDIFI